MSSENILYDEIEPFNSGMLKVSDAHEIYYEESGCKDGMPVLVVHGGPGDSSSPKHRRRFNPEKFRIILFDQRGAGQSLPKACLKENTTQHLVADMEKLRVHLGVDKWMLQATSWGSTLSLVCAQAHPDKVLGKFSSAGNTSKWYFPCLPCEHRLDTRSKWGRAHFP